MVRRIKKVEATLPIEYLQRVGYLQVMAYILSLVNLGTFSSLVRGTTLLLIEWDC